MNLLRPIVIDTDAGWDDWLALLFLMKCPELGIQGVTVTGVGEAHLTPGMKHIQGLLVFGGQSAHVYPGAQKPLIYSNVFPRSFRKQIDEFYGVGIPPAPGKVGTSTISTTSAVDFLYQTFVTAARQSAPVDVLCIGGFTNLATLLGERPLAEYQAGIGAVYAMAGAVNVGGNVATSDDDTWGYYGNNTTAEWNVFIDAKAAEVVLRAGLRLVLVPLDATNAVPVTKAFVDAYGRAAGDDRYAGFVHQLLQLQAGGTDFFDPLAAAVLLTQGANTLVTAETLRLQVSTDLDEENNTVGALTRTDDTSFSEVVVCTSANGTVFENLFQSTTLPQQR